MDYDDNEFQGQNLQLAGEGSTKFPPDLRPYALPKFDFDDSLHGHLRFDSLVETEVFLGIESNEDNQWIDDFSRGSTGIEFRTSAAESCSISRHNNVWSEAASSESVEMLLKSVGQEDNIPGKTIVRELDACDELGCLIKQMDPGSKRDDGSLSKSGDAINAKSTLPSHEILVNFSGLKEDVGEGQLSGLKDVVGEGQPLVAVASQKIEGESSGDGGLADPVPDAVSGMGSLPLTEGISIADQRKIDTIVESSDNGTGEDSSASVTHIDVLSTCAQNSSISSVELKSDISKNVDDFQTDGGGEGEEHPFVQEAKKNEQNLDGNVAGGNGTEVSINDAEEPSNRMLKGDSDLHMVEGHTEYIQAGKCENQVLLESTEIGDPLKVNMLKASVVAIKHDNIFESPKVEVSNVNDSEASLLSVEDNKVSKAEVDGSSSSHGGDISTANVECSTAKMLRETQVAVTSRGDNDASVVIEEASNADTNVSSFTLSGSTEIREEVVVSGQSDAHKCDPSISPEAKESRELPPNCANNDYEVAGSVIMDKGVGTTSLGEGITTNELISEPLSDSTTGHELVEGVHLQSMNTVVANAASIHQEFQKRDACHVESQSDPQGVLNEVIQEHKNGIEECTIVCDPKIVDDDDAGAHVIFGDGAEAQVISEKHEEVTVKENYEKLSTKVSDAESEPKEDEMPAQTLPLPSEEICCDAGPNSQENNITTAVSGDEKFEQIAVSSIDGVTVKVHEDTINSTPLSESNTKFRVLESGSGCTDPGEPTCGSPTVIRATELSLSESEKKRINESTDANVPDTGDINGAANKICSVPPDPKCNDASKGEKNFTFEVTSLAESPAIEAGKNWQPFTTTEASKVSQIAEGSPSTSGIGQLNPKAAQDVARGSLQVSNRETGRSGTKGTFERKNRRASSKAAGKESAKKGSTVKDTTSVRQLEKGEKPSNASLGPSGIGQRLQSNEMLQYGPVDCSNMKTIGALTTSTSTLPDLNTSSPVVFQQPFTDLQQVQLRAQIFVYGALIQGAAPDEAYMISAFGGPDGGRTIWDAAWRACMERLHGQKSILSNSETPLQSRSGARAPDQAVKHGATQGKVASSPLGRTSSKGTPSPIVNPMIPLSSPLWSIPTPSGDAMQSSGMPRGAMMDYQQALSPLHPHQTPPVRNFVGHNTWISQAPFRATWVASPQTSAFDTGARFPVLPITEPVQLKEPSVPHSSGVKSISSGPLIQNASAANVFPGTSPILDSRKVTVSPGQPTDPKPRKRKKTTVSENSSKIMLHPQSQTETVLAPIGTSHISTSVSITTPASLVSKVSLEGFIPVPPTISTDHILNLETRQRSTLSEEITTKLKEARTQAEDASASAAVAVSHTQEIWNQLDRQKNSGLVPHVESKLASAAVMAAAAAAVARAAAAAANVASNAALQAKLMADEALNSSGYGNLSENSETLFDSMKIMGKATPASILKGENPKSSSSSIILAAREAARRNVEAASAASKRAENMDAIVKAAELAAEAVSQAGKIVAMGGDPLSFSDLIEAGMEGYWRVPQSSAQPVANSSDGKVERLDGVREGPDTSAKHSKEVLSDNRETHTANPEMLTTSRELLGESIEERARLVDGISGSLATSVKSTKGQRGGKASDLTKTIGVVPESEIGSRSSSIIIQIEHGKEVEPLKENSIKEGSHVEVFREGSQFKAAWFTANVLSLKDGKAYVCYTELPSDEGSEKLKEWVALEGEGDKAPKIRIARPITALPFEGTRKRRRAAMAEYTWSVGDRVDAWMRDSWWEGIVTEKSKKDETTFTIHFQAQGETAAVRAWHLRPSLIWKDGEWVESTSSTEKSRASHEVDTRQEKRLRMGSPAAEAKGKDKISKGTEAVEAGRSDEPRLLDLCANEKVFNIGKSSVAESKPETLRMIRTGLQKEGSRVVFGVPKPGKKRKFMEVSKHYVVDQGSKLTEANDSVKFAKYLMPQGQGSGSRAWKNVSRNEPKEKRATLAKPKVPKAGKLPSVSGRTIPQKDKVVSPAVSAPDNGASIDHVEKIKDSAGHVENTSEKHDMMEFQSLSSSDGAAAGPVLFSSMPLSSEAPSKKVSASNTRTERVTKGKLAPAGGRLTKIDEDKVFNANVTKSTSEVVEPRRSNRRIQPTSRLLEGLQSSLIISKIPSASHDRSHKNQNRATSRGNNHG